MVVLSPPNEFIEVPGYEGILWANYWTGQVKGSKGKLLTPQINWKGYLRIATYSRKTIGRIDPYFHRVIASLKYGWKKMKDMQIDHIDKNKENNKGWNLRLVTLEKNLYYRDNPDFPPGIQDEDLPF